MLQTLEGLTSDRKARLFGCAECRARVHLFFHRSSVEAMEILERYVEGDATHDDLGYAHYTAETPFLCWDQDISTSGRFIPNEGVPFRERDGIPGWVSRLVELGVISAGSHQLLDSPDATERRRRVLDAARLVDCCTYLDSGVTLPALVDDPPPLGADDWSGGWLVRDIFGNPFQRAVFDPSWRTEVVVGLARGMYEARDFGPIPVLADALEDAGCADIDILGHCRGPSPHVRGCWVVDLVLGRE